MKSILIALCLASCAPAVSPGITATKEVVCINDQDECWSEARRLCIYGYSIVGEDVRMEGRPEQNGQVRFVYQIVCSEPSFKRLPQ